MPRAGPTIQSSGIKCCVILYRATMNHVFICIFKWLAPSQQPFLIETKDGQKTMRSFFGPVSRGGFSSTVHRGNMLLLQVGLQLNTSKSLEQSFEPRSAGTRSALLATFFLPGVCLTSFCKRTSAAVSAFSFAIFWVNLVAMAWVSPTLA